MNKNSALNFRIYIVYSNKFEHKKLPVDHCTARMCVNTSFLDDFEMSRWSSPLGSILEYIFCYSGKITNRNARLWLSKMTYKFTRLYNIYPNISLFLPFRHDNKTYNSQNFSVYFCKKKKYTVKNPI